jgi:hypothetical protein
MPLLPNLVSSRIKKKEKKGISVNKFPVFRGIEGGARCKNQILNELLAESRQIRTYKPDFQASTG